LIDIDEKVSYCFIVLLLYSHKNFPFLFLLFHSTLIVQFRHSFELGGLYWSANVVVNQAFCFLSVYLYGQYSEENVSEEVMVTLWKVVGGLFVVSMLFFGGFLKLIYKDYIKTFSSTNSGPQFLCNKFHISVTDSAKFDIFGSHPSYYKRIDEELMKWLNDNWEQWEESSPDWFTAEAIAKVP